MSDTAALAFLLDSPMQAWGASSRFQRRETESFPVKSSLSGLIAAALGIDKHQPDEVERLALIGSLRTSVYRLVRRRDDEVLRLVDFHTIGGGYDKSASPMEKMSIPRKASGPPFGTVITRRTYLTDARFAAVLCGEVETIRDAAAALSDPVWGVWFGRKACLPALPLSPITAATPNVALSLLLDRLAEWTGKPAPDIASLECWDEPETTDPEEGDFFLHDAPISFGKRTFAARPIRHRRATKSMEIPAEQRSQSESIPGAFFDSLPED